ncbi:MAG: GGDEF domain-containing protein [Silvanigrellaceae bacterium]
MSIAVYDHDKQHLSDLTEVLQEAGHFDSLCTDDLSKLKETMNLLGCNQQNIRVDINLLILDLDQVPESLDFLRMLKTDVRYKDIPIIVTSEMDFDQHVRTAYAYGANDFLRKPINRSEAKARIHSSLRLNHEIDRRKARENEITEIANQLRDLTQVLMKLSLIDQLTGVANRRAFDQTLEQEFKRARRNHRPISLLLFDVDHFKLFNDTYGHQAGDLCLRKLAQEVSASIKRPGDMLARYGGEEFAIILPDTDAAGAGVIGQRILETVRGLSIRHENNSACNVVTVSVGSATYIEGGGASDMNSLLQMADKALYQAKSAGRNQVSQGGLESVTSSNDRAS